jgi:transposase
MCWSGLVSERIPYSTDLSDERWELIRPVLTAWKNAHPSVSGHSGQFELREIVNGILHQARAGCAWRLLLMIFRRGRRCITTSRSGATTAPTR